MGKSSKTSNQAVPNIQPTAATKPTTSVSSGTKSSGSSGSYSSGRSYGGSGSGYEGSGASIDPGPTYTNQFYNAYAGYTPPSSANLIDIGQQAVAAQAVVNNARASIPKADVQKVDRVDIADYEKELKALADAQKEQAVQQIEYAVQKGANDLNRVYEDALPQFQNQRNRIAAEEAAAKDNQVLYAAKRGDAGGIGQSQYGSVQNTAQTNRQTVNSAQIRLYTDTARQISDLNAQGEFEKADKVLAISQDYSKKLMDIQKWAKEKNLDVDEFNAKIDEWKAEYDLSVARYLTDTELSAAKTAGAFSSGIPTIDTVNGMADRYSAGGKAMMSAGIVPSSEQLSAMGWTPEQYWIYKMANMVQ